MNIRSVVRRSYALIDSEGHVESYLPVWGRARCVVLISPRMGARFVQLLVEISAREVAEGTSGERELFIFVLEGGMEANVGGEVAILTRGGYFYVPPKEGYRIKAQEGGVRLLVFERVYVPFEGPPPTVFGREEVVDGVPFMGDEDAILKILLPEKPVFDMAVNIFTFQPGATLPFMEVHVMEHGLLMLQGQGIYRLADSWHPVQRGDAIWMAPHCPQWFVATGKEPAKYIYYKDVNRNPPLQEEGR